jgi:hypothetical protein
MSFLPDLFIQGMVKHSIERERERELSEREGRMSGESLKKIQTV